MILVDRFNALMQRATERPYCGSYGRFGIKEGAETGKPALGPKMDEASESLKQTVTYVAKVHIWRTDGAEGRCGHSSFSIHQVIDGEEKELYAGLWPFGPLAANPLMSAFAAVPGMVNQSRELCELSEAEDPEGKRKMKPDIVFTLDLSPEMFEELESDMKKDVKDAEKGKMLYGMFAKANLFSLVRKFAEKSFIEAFSNGQVFEQNLWDSFENREFSSCASKILKTRVNNCTTLVIGYLEKMEIIVPSSAPYGCSPSGLEGTLAGSSRVVHAESHDQPEGILTSSEDDRNPFES